MTQGSRLASYHARVAAKAVEAPLNACDETQPPIEPEEGEIEDEENPVTTTTEKPAAAAPAPAAPTPAAAAPAAPAPAAAIDHKARMKAVFAHADVKGKEGLAADLLADSDYDSLSAEGIIKILGKSPTAAPAAGDDDTGKRMLAAMTVETEDLGRDAEAAAEAKAKAENYGWDKIHAEVDERRKISA